ncbi:MAG: zinc-ribbon domain-containing protein [Alphaproteobacteria bacterium GM202ARS2]|nr:zinc-ribbon domain-containing protein [Alphaproteobacteria bacterium GM202ARS2]
MIISCPSCSTDFSVADSMIPQGGRRCRCNQCGHIWDAYPHASSSPPQLHDNPHLQRMAQAFPSSDRGSFVQGAINQWEEELNEILYGKKKAWWKLGFDKAKQHIRRATKSKPRKPMFSSLPVPPAEPRPRVRSTPKKPSSPHQTSHHVKGFGYGLRTSFLFLVSFVFFVASLYYAFLYPCYNPHSVLVFDFACTYASPAFNIEVPMEEWRQFFL